MLATLHIYVYMYRMTTITTGMEFLRFVIIFFTKIILYIIQKKKSSRENRDVEKYLFQQIVRKQIVRRSTASVWQVQCFHSM